MQSYFEATHNEKGEFLWEERYKWYTKILHDEYDSGYYGFFSVEIGTGKEKDTFNECLAYETGFVNEKAVSKWAGAIKWNAGDLDDRLDDLGDEAEAKGMPFEKFDKLQKLYKDMRKEFYNRFQANQKAIDADTARMNAEKQPKRKRRITP